MRLLISGYRDFSNYSIILSNIENIVKDCDDIELILGDCKGVDDTAFKIAISRGWKTKVFYADWSNGLSAGPIRNEQMVITGLPDHALLFLSPLSKGTKNMEKLCMKHKIPITIINV